MQQDARIEDQSRLQNGAQAGQNATAGDHPPKRPWYHRLRPLFLSTPPMLPQLATAVAVVAWLSGSLLRQTLVRWRWSTAATFPRSSTTRTSSMSSVESVAGPSEEPVSQAAKPGTRTSELPHGLLQESLPRHVAVIMDGNARWSKARGLPASAGHEEGCRALMNIVNLSAAWGIRVLTVFAFSRENWLRPKAEVDFIMWLMESWIRDRLQEFHRVGVRVLTIGDPSKLPVSLKAIIKEAADLTKSNTALTLCVAINYSGRDEIVRACQKISLKAKDGIIMPQDITDSDVAKELDTIEFVDPDLIIRTSGELRLSNFLLWQLAYSELFFSKAFWPDFGESEYMEALLSFQRRHRRYGKRDFKN